MRITDSDNIKTAIKSVNPDGNGKIILDDNVFHNQYCHGNHDTLKLLLVNYENGVSVSPSTTGILYVKKMEVEIRYSKDVSFISNKLMNVIIKINDWFKQMDKPMTSIYTNMMIQYEAEKAVKYAAKKYIMSHPDSSPFIDFIENSTVDFWQLT